MLDHPDDAAPRIDWWSLDADALWRRAGSGPEGLSAREAARRLRRGGRNVLAAERPLSRLRTLAAQLRNPLLLLLAFAAAGSMFGAEWVDAAIVLAIIGGSVGIGYAREYDAQSALEALRRRIRPTATVVRDGREQRVPAAELVVGDVVRLSAGSVVPADAVVFEAVDCHVSEAVLTGESFPVRKSAEPAPANAPLARRGNGVFLGTNVRSGAARCVVVATGAATEFGAIAARLSLRAPDTAFERGLKSFGYLLTTTMLVVVMAVFVAHALAGRPTVDTLLFSIALAVALSPELLPAIVSVNLARGARTLARHGVLVRRLSAIENLGSMDVLCTDKTGTLTEGRVRLEGAYDAEGRPAPAVLELAAINAALQTGYANPLDDAILEAHRPELAGVRKLGEVPFDFVRKRVTVVVEDANGPRFVGKGAFRQVLAECATTAGGAPLDDAARAALTSRFEAWSAQGIRVVAVATGMAPERAVYGRDDERGLSFAGFLCFADRPKPGAAIALAALGAAGVAVKVISGDSDLVCRRVAAEVGLGAGRVLSGAELDELHDEALWREAERTDLFVEVDPNQKERIILALRRMGHVVGFLGDGVNDAPALHAADAGLSVDGAVDVARDAADFVLLERDLDVIRRGVVEGRRTFANTLKYLLTTTSANLGNMVSMALASLFLPFLPLLAGQILLNNVLSDIPAVGLADDAVDAELVARPRRWDLGFIRRFMVEFGLLSSIFDVVTFVVLLAVFAAPPAVFRSGWFVESLLTELVIALVVRTRRPFFRSRPGRVLLWSSAVLVPVALAIPYLPPLRVMGFAPLPPALLAVLLAITGLYVAAAELLKRWFYRESPRART